MKFTGRGDPPLHHVLGTLDADHRVRIIPGESDKDGRALCVECNHPIRAKWTGVESSRLVIDETAPPPEPRGFPVMDDDGSGPGVPAKPRPRAPAPAAAAEPTPDPVTVEAHA